MAASLNDIYKSLGDLNATVKGLAEKIDANERRNLEAIRRSDESRANVHRRLDDLSDKAAHMETQMSDVKKRVGEMQDVTDGVKELHQRAQGAGTLGQWAIKIGIGVVMVIGWAVGAYTYLTGRPPP